MIPLIVTSLAILAAMVVMGFLYAKQRGKFSLIPFLQSFGLDVSEGVESLIYGIRTVILLALEFVFAHLEAQTLASVMPYREGAYEMGLAMALVAMIAGMTFATEWKLQIDRRKNILPAIVALNIDKVIKEQMVNRYHRKYMSSAIVMYMSLIVALAMHTAIVLIGVSSLGQHQTYAMMVSTGQVQEIAGMPPLHYTVWFKFPLLVSSSLVGGLGFVIDVMLGMTSNIVEELYKYMPSREIMETSSKIEAEFPSGVTKPTTPPQVPTPPAPGVDPLIVTYEDTISLVEDALQEEYELELNFTGDEDIDSLLEDIVDVFDVSSLVSEQIALPFAEINDNLSKGTTNTKQTFTNIIRTAYKGLVAGQQDLTKLVKDIVITSDELRKAIDTSDSSMSSLHSKLKTQLKKFEEAIPKNAKIADDLVKALNRIPKV